VPQVFVHVLKVAIKMSDKLPHRYQLFNILTDSGGAGGKCLSRMIIGAGGGGVGGCR
jgi:hypothetical protein